MDQINYSELLNTVRKLVSENATRIFAEVVDEARNISSILEEVPNVAKDFTLRGGKRLRALLILLGYWSRKWGLPVEGIKPLLAGIEFLQSYLLVHDDIMDRDELRRGGPTVHVVFRNKCIEDKLLGDCEHYGISQAIIVGDYLESLAVYMFSKLNLPSNTFARLIERYAKGLRIVSYGQYLDVLLAQKPLQRVSVDDVLLVHKLKTASYTVELPLHLGALASNMYSPELLNELSAYAIPAGIAFQLKDDILGLYGDPSITGKPAGSDVREKKKTVLIVKAYELADEDDRRFLEEIYNTRKPDEITSEDIERVREIVKNTGSYDYTLKLMKRKAEEARNALRNSILICEEARNALDWLLDLFIRREK
ncbi:MAG: polyprenyl synthetase family protein [Thermoprotei archaeon]